MISTHIDLLCMWLKSVGCMWSVLTLNCSVCDLNRYAVYESIHIGLRYMWVKSVSSVWSVLTSICSICDSNRYTMYIQGSSQSVIHVTPNRCCMSSPHTDQQCPICSGLAPVCGVYSASSLFAVLVPEWPEIVTLCDFGSLKSSSLNTNKREKSGFLPRCCSKPQN